jgi:hypothetical protein
MTTTEPEAGVLPVVTSPVIINNVPDVTWFPLLSQLLLQYLVCRPVIDEEPALSFSLGS